MIKSVDLHVSEVKRVDARMAPGFSEEITVVPERAGGIDSAEVTTSLDQQLVNSLPMGRGITDIARLAPGVHDTGPGKQLSIHGAPSTDNLYLVNGAVITEGHRNQPQNLFIEDAILECRGLRGSDPSGRARSDTGRQGHARRRHLRDGRGGARGRAAAVARVRIAITDRARIIGPVAAGRHDGCGRHGRFSGAGDRARCGESRGGDDRRMPGAVE